MFSRVQDECGKRVIGKAGVVWVGWVEAPEVVTHHRKTLSLCPQRRVPKFPSACYFDALERVGRPLKIKGLAWDSLFLPADMFWIVEVSSHRQPVSM